MPANKYNSTTKTWVGPDGTIYYIIGSVNKTGIACTVCGTTTTTTTSSG